MIKRFSPYIVSKQDINAQKKDVSLMKPMLSMA
jgi:hypothetical protein